MVSEFVSKDGCIDWLVVSAHEEWGIWIEYESGLQANVMVMRESGNWADGAAILCNEQVHTFSQTVTLRMLQV